MKIQNTLFFDYQATTPVDPLVFDAMEPYLRESFGNPHSADHILGWRAASDVEKARDSIAKLVGADTDEIIFTSGATEANNHALLGLASGPLGESRRQIIVSAIEHKCILQTAAALSENHGFEIKHLNVDKSGYVDHDILEELLSDEVLLVSVMSVNNEIGTIQDIEKIYQVCHKHGVLLHCDAAQAPQAHDMQTLGRSADLISLSGHKMYGPQGIGVLYIRRGIQSSIKPLLNGGGQQKGLRSGTIPLPLVIGMSAAADILLKEDAQTERARIQAMRDRFMECLEEKMPMIGLNGSPLSQRHPGNLNIRFLGVRAHDLLMTLQPGLAASSGSACTSGTPGPSHVLQAIGLTSREADTSVRFSIGRFTEEHHIDEAVNLIKAAYDQLITLEKIDITKGEGH